MFRNGWDNNIKSADAIPVQENGSRARTAEAGGAATVTIPLAPLRKEDARNKELEEAWEYYHTPRCQYPTAPGFATARSLNQIITYDAYNMAEVFLPHPLQKLTDDQQVTTLQRRVCSPEARGLRGRAGERPFSNCESA